MTVQPPPPVSPPPRQRRKPAVALATPMGYPVIGGPRRPKDLPPGMVFPAGTYHALPGRPIPTWPWRAGTDIIGMIYHEYRSTTAGLAFVATHIYRLDAREWRYAGKAASWLDAKTKLDRLHEQARQAVQLVAGVSAPPPRTRKVAG